MSIELVQRNYEAAVENGYAQDCANDEDFASDLLNYSSDFGDSTYGEVLLVVKAWRKSIDNT